MTGILEILRRLRAGAAADGQWERVKPLLEGLSLDEVIELDHRITLGSDDLRAYGPATLKRLVVEFLQQRKLAAFVYECFDPFVNPWVLEARMEALFWRLEFIRSLADQLEEIAEAHKYDLEVPWTVNGNLFGMANSALLAWHMGGWDDSAPGYGQGEPPPALDFRAGPAPAARRARAG
jgi:hypothetical protein